MAVWYTILALLNDRLIVKQCSRAERWGSAWAMSVEEDGESQVVAVAVAAAVTAGLKTAISWQCKRSGC